MIQYWAGAAALETVSSQISSDPPDRDVHCCSSTLGRPSLLVSRPTNRSMSGTAAVVVARTR